MHIHIPDLRQRDQKRRVPRILNRSGRAVSRVVGVLRLVIPVVTAGCAASTSHSPRFAARSLTEIEMDRITVGDARATSFASAQAIGSTATAFTSTSDQGVASGSPPAGTPFLDYATSQSQASGAAAEAAQADGAGEIFVGSGSQLGAGANVASSASATGDARAQVNVQLYGVSTTNHTSVVFGTTDAVACCAPHASAQATVDTFAEGPYATGQQASRIELNAGAIESTTDFVEVSSSLPIIDPSQLAAARDGPIPPGY